MMKYLTFIAAVLVIRAVAVADEYNRGFEDVLSKVPQEYKKERDKVDTALKGFRAREVSLTDTFKEALTNRETAITSSVGETIGEKELSQIRELKTWLEGSGDIPKCDLLTKPVIAYAQGLYKARGKLDRPLEALIKLLTRKHLDSLAKDLRDAYYKLGRILDARDSIKNGVVFRGGRQENGSDRQTSFLIRFDNVSEKGEFSGAVERDYMYAGHPKHEFVGHVQGLAIRAQTGVSLANPGNNEDLRYLYQGFVIGRALVGQYVGRTDKGKVHQGTFYMTR